MSSSKLVPGEIVTSYIGILTDVVIESEQGPGELFMSISTLIWFQYQQSNLS